MYMLECLLTGIMQNISHKKLIYLGTQAQMGFRPINYQRKNPFGFIFLSTPIPITLLPILTIAPLLLILTGSRNKVHL